MKTRDVSIVNHSKLLFVFTLILFLLLFAQPVEPQHATNIQLRATNQTQTDILFQFQGLNYTVINQTRGELILNEPISWKLLLTNGVELFTVDYETKPIYLLEEESIDATSWTKTFTLETDFKEGYEDVSFETHVKSTKNITIEPNYSYDITPYNHLQIHIPFIQEEETIVVTGTTKAQYNKIVFQTKEGPVLFNIPNGVLNHFSTQYGLMDFSIVDMDLEQDMKLSIAFPYLISNKTRFYIQSDLQTQPLYLPYTIDNNKVTLDPGLAFGLLSNLANQELHIYAELVEQERPKTNFTLTTSKETYLLGDVIEAFVTPQNATTFIYIITPGGSVSLLSNNAHVATEIGTHSLEASIYYQNESATLTTEVEVVNTTVQNVSLEQETPIGIVTIETEQAIVKTFTINEDLEVDIALTNLTNSTIKTTLQLPRKITEGTYFYLWQKTNSGLYIQIPYELSESRTELQLQLMDGVIDADELENGIIQIKFKLMLPDKELFVRSDIGKEQARIYEGIEEEQTGRIGIAENEKAIMQLQTSLGSIEEVYVVSPENIPVKAPNTNFISDLLKFKVENLNEGETIQVDIELEKIPENFAVWKFNPNTLKWYLFPGEKISENTIRIEITDGGLGDDDGIVNGIIEDDIAVTSGETYLRIWDRSDSEIIRENQYNVYYANYSNATSSNPITGTGTYCEFIHNMSGSWSTPVNMTYNSASTLYEYAQLYASAGNNSFNISCFTNQSFINLSLVDDLNISTNTIPTHNDPTLSAATIANSSDDDLTCYNQSTNDVDGDAVENIYVWKKNGASMANLYYPFSSPDTVLRDFSSYENNGTLPHGRYTENGKIGGGFEFNGSYGGNLGHDPSITTFDEFSAEYWVNFNSADAGTDLLHKNSNYILRYAVYSGTDVRPSFIMYLDGSYKSLAVDYADRIQNAVGKWTHMAYTYNGSEARIYINGVLTANDSSWNGSLSHSATDTYLGGNPSGALFDGILDEFRIYNYSLSPEQIQEHYDLGNQNLSYNTIVSEETQEGDVWQCEVTPTDNFADGNSKQSNNLSVQTNTLNIEDITLQSSLKTNLTSENLTCNFTSTFSTITTAINWINNGTSTTVLRMPFEGNETNALQDYSGLVNIGTNNGATWNATGGFDGNGSFEFDEGIQSISIVDDASLDITDELTLMAWIYPKRTDLAYQYVLSKADGASRPYALLLENGDVKFFINDWGSNELVQSAAIATNNWYHLAATYDGSNMRLYINGVEVNSRVETATITTDASDLLISCRGDGTGSYTYCFNGTIDEVAVYNLSLSAEQIQTIYENKTNILVSQETNIGDNWTCEVTPFNQTHAGITQTSNSVQIVPLTIDRGELYGWFDQNWNYRSSLLVTNSLNQNLTNYTYSLTFNEENFPNLNWSEDENSLRFRMINQTDNSNIYTPYWIESWNSSLKEAVVWIKLPYLPANAYDAGDGLGVSTIDVYYGNNQASDEQNPNDVFDYFANFSSAPIQALNSQDGAGGQPTNYVVLDDETLRVWGNAWKAIEQNITFVADGSQIVEFEMKANSTTGEIYGISFQSVGSGIDSGKTYQFAGTQSWGLLTPETTYSGENIWQSVNMILDDYAVTNEDLAIIVDDDSDGNADITVRKFRIRTVISTEPTSTFSNISEFVSYLNTTIDRPQDQTDYNRYESLIFNGTTICERGDCDEVIIKPQYLGSNLPEKTFLETTNEDFNSNENNTNISVVLNSVQLSQEQGIAWWDEDWIYRTGLNITHSTVNQTNYAIRLTLDNTTLSNNFNWNLPNQGLRFVYYNKTSQLQSQTSHYITDWSTTSQNMTVYVLLPFIGNQSTETIYIYYGNGAANKQENPEEVFELFINFSDYSITALNNQDAATGTSVATIINDTALQLYGNSWKAIATSFDVLGDGSQLLELEMKAGDSYGEIYGVSFETINSGTNANRLYQFAGTQNWGSATTLIDYTSEPNWQYVSAVLDDYISSKEAMGFLADDDADANANVTFKNVRIRSYVSPEPTLETSTSEEELNFTSSGDYLSTIFDTGSNSVYYENISWSAQINENESLQIYTRTSEDNITWTPWFEEVNNAIPQSTPQRYVQYRVNLSTLNTQQTPKLEDITITYKSISTIWTDILPSGNAFSATNYLCGQLNQTQSTCTPNIPVTPYSQGEYLVRLFSSSNDSRIVDNSSNQRNITIYLNPSFAEFTSDDNVVVRGETVALHAKLVDEASVSLPNYNLTIYDETANGSRQFVGWAVTDSQGNINLDYAPMTDYILGTHRLNISYNGSEIQYIRSVQQNHTITVSSRPEINAIQESRREIGYGSNTTISANITGIVGLDTVYINITGSNGNNFYEEMNLQSGTNYTYFFNDTWHLEDYEFVIIATNIDGIKTISSSREFSVISSISIKYMTEKEDYENKELVYINGTGTSLYPQWNFKIPINISATTTLQKQQVEISLDSDNFEFSSANVDGSDIRFSYYNQTTDQEQELPYWIEFWNATSKRASIWIQLSEITTSEQTIYMYYGNNATTDAQNGSGVFIFFDDFEIWDTNWVNVSSSYTIGAGEFGQSSARSKSGSYSAYKDGITTGQHNDPSGGYYTLPTTLGRDIVLEAYINRNSGSTGGTRDRIGLFDSGTGGYGWAYTNGGALSVESRNSGMTGTDRVTATASTAQDEWVDAQLFVLADGTITSNRIIQGILDSTASWSDSSFTSFDRVYIAGGYDYWVDDMRIRKYTDVPISTTFGSPEAVRLGVTNELNTNTKGYLRMLTQYYNGLTWDNRVPTVIDHELFTLGPYSYLDVAHLWEINGGWNTTTQRPGTYRVFAIVEDDDRNALKNSNGEDLIYYYNFTIKQPQLIVSQLLHEHQQEHSLNEYETQGTIDWINVTVEAQNNTAYDANVTLSLLDIILQPVHFGPNNEVQLCGDLAIGETCENTWDNTSSGYLIPKDASAGTYDFFWNISMLSDNGPRTENKTTSITIHHLPANVSGTLDQIRIFKPNATTIRFNLTNPWSENLTSLSATINCPALSGFDCQGENSATLIETATTLGSLNSFIFNFTIDVNDSIVSNNYDLNITLNYTNPAGESISWNEIASTTLEVREKAILEIQDIYHPTNVTRGQTYELNASINNTGETQATSGYLNYTFPTGWTVATGTKNQTYPTINSGSLAFNNLTTTIGISSSLGPQTVRLDSGASDGRTDFITYITDVYAPTTQTASKNQTFVDQGESIELQATLQFDNATTVANENMTFYDITESTYLGWAITDSLGVARLEYPINTSHSLGVHTISTNYSGSDTIYTRSSSTTTTIDVHAKPLISNFNKTPNIAGYGQGIEFNATITDVDDINTALLRITYPNTSTVDYEMDFTPPFDYDYAFTNTWQSGLYIVELIANDTLGSTSSQTTNFTIKTITGMFLETINTSYGANEDVNLSTPVTPWWNSTYTAYKEINVTNAGSEVDNYSLEIIVDTENISIQSDCGDIRFTLYNASSKTHTLLEYYNETVCNTTSTTTFWAKLPELEAGLNQVYMYYDADQTITPNPIEPEDMFIFYDDFETWSGWTTNGNGAVVQDSAQAVSGTYSAYKTTDSDPNGAYKEIGTTLGRDIIMEAWVQRKDPYGGGGTDRIGVINDAGYAYGWAFTQGSNQLLVDERSSYSSSGSTSNGVAVTGRMNEWVYAKLEIRSSGNLVNVSSYYNGNLEGSTSKADTTVNDFTRVYIFGGYEYWVDDMRVRNYADITTSIGTEKKAGSQVVNDLDYPTNAYLYLAVQKNNSGWQHVQTIIDDSLLRTINSSHLDIAALYNVAPWNTQTASAGTYRIYGELRDPQGAQLIDSNGNSSTAYSIFTIEQAETVLNISSIRVYDVTSALPSNRKSYTNELLDQGLNKTFQLTNGSIYRFEIDIENTGTNTWTINGSDVMYNYMQNFNVSDSLIWYSNVSSLISRRTDTTTVPGSYGQSIDWGVSTYPVTLTNGSTATFFAIIEINDTTNRQVEFKINSSNYAYSDLSTIEVFLSDTQAPQLYNNIYNITPKEVIRGNDFTIYARWNEEIENSTVRYSTTSPIIFATTTNLTAQNSQNWTNFTIESLSTWNLGNHTAQIKVSDPLGNENDTLEYINFTVYGQSNIQTASLNDSSLIVGESTRLTCKVVDATVSNSPLTGYTVYFKNQTHTLGTNQTIANGEASYVYTDITPGIEQITCWIENNEAAYYKVNINESSHELTTIELEAPTYSSISGPNIANKGETITLSTFWQDNNQLQIATLEVNISGNVSTQVLTGVTDWANISYQVPTIMTPGNITWKQYGNDTYNNMNQTPSQTIAIYGWSEIALSTVNPSSMRTTNTTTYTCTVQDANDSTLLNNYPVNFYYKNQSDPIYISLGQNNTNASGKAKYSFVVNDVGTYDVKCNITDNGVYNSTGQNSQIKQLNVVSGTDVYPPKIVGLNYTVNTTSLVRGECILISGLWDETINESYIEYNRTPSTILTKNISAPYIGNWTNGTLCMNNSWTPGRYDIKLIATDMEGNTNNSLSYFTAIFQGRSNITYIEPKGTLLRELITVTCQVQDKDTGSGIENYPVSFYDTDLGFSIGSDNTNATGYASVSYDYTNHPVGPDEISCTIASQPSKYYVAQAPLTVSETVIFGGNMTINITQPITNQILHRSDEETLEATLLDENNNTVLGATIEWLNSTNDVLATGNETTWTVPNNYPLGSQTIEVNATKTNFGSSNDTQLITVYGYSQVNLQTPSTGVYGDNTLLNVTCLVSDATEGSALANYEINITRNATPVLSQNSNTTGQVLYQVNTNTLAEGNHEFMCTIGNDATKYYTKKIPYMSTVVVNIDKSNPTINYNPTTDATGIYAKDWIMVNVSAQDTNLDEVQLNWSGSQSAFTTINGNNYWTNVSSLTEGVYTFNALANDTLGLTNTTTLRTVTIDLNDPNLAVQQPTNNSYTNQTSTTLNYTVTDLTLDSCWYTLNGGANQPLAGCTNTTINSLIEGQNNITLYANDLAGHQSSQKIVITRDTQKPSLTVQSPTNSTTYFTPSIDINYTVSDTNPISKCWYTLNGGSQQTLASCTNTTINGLSNMWHTLVVGVNDTAGNENTTSITFNISYFELVATPIYPFNNSVLTSTTTDLNASTNIEALECNYTLDESTIAAMTSSDNLSWSTSVSSLAQGAHNVSFTCQDATNTTTTGMHFFTVDSLGPIISFESPTPTNNTGRSVDWLIVNSSLNENGNGAVLEWTNSSGSFNFTMDNTSLTHYYYNVSNLADATYTYKIYANDTYNNQGVSETRTVLVTTQEPVIIITSPIQGQEYLRTIVDFNLSATKEISTWTFNLNGENFTFEPNVTLTPMFGNNELTVWATDTYGLTGIASVNFTVNASSWEDRFGTYTGLLESTNLGTGQNASTLFCWSALSSATTPQDNPITCWPYRRDIDLTTATTLTDYQLKLELNLSNEVGAGKANANCSDLRFTYSNTTDSQKATLPYWIESCNGANPAIVWVKIPRINSSTQIQVYYGNKYAEDESNGTAVFNFFDEMDAISTSDWGSNAVRWSSNNNQSYPTVAGSTARITADHTTPSSFATELWIQANATSGAAGYYSVGTSSKYVTMYFETSNSRVNLYNGGNNYYSTNASAMQKYTIITDFTNNDYDLYINNSDTAAISLASSASGSQTKPVLYPYYIQGLFVDRIAIRSYSTNHPTQSALGSEQTPIVNATIQSELLQPEVIAIWDEFKAITTTPTGTTITFQILNETNHSICGNITTAQASAGYPICANAMNNSIYLYAKLTTDTTQKTATILNWSATWNETYTDTENPVVQLQNPTNYSGDNDGNIVLLYNVSDNWIIDRCRLYLNEAVDQTNISSVEGTTRTFSLSNLAIGQYNWTVECEDVTGNKANATQRSFTVLDTTEFDHATNFTNENVANLENITLNKTGLGDIIFTTTIDLSTGTNISQHIEITPGNITVDSATEPRLNTSAELAMYGLGYQATPIIVKDGTNCYAPNCEVLSYNAGTGKLIFNVGSFSSYTTTNNSQLLIEDEVDQGQTKLATEQVTFFANYTYIENNTPITGAGVSCNFTENSTGAWSTPISMTYNVTSKLYETNKSFATEGTHVWNVSCNGVLQDGEPVATFDTVLVEEYIAPDMTYPNISFVEPTNNDSSYTKFNWIYINVSAQDATNLSAYIDFNKSLLGYWNFENVTGTTVQDGASYSLHANLTNGAYQTGTPQTEIRGNYTQLDGEDDYVQVAYNETLNTVKEFTIEAWIKEGSQSESWAQIANRDGDDGFNLQHNNGNTQFEFAVRTTNGRQYISAAPTGGLEQDKWYHILGTYDGSWITLYVNGEQIARRAHTGDMLTSTSPLVIGARYVDPGYDRQFNGSIDEVKYWNRSLTPYEINMSYYLQENTFNLNKTSLPEGNHTFIACAIDRGGNKNCTETRTVTVDQTNPSIIIENPTPENQSYRNNSWAYINVSVNEFNLENVTLNWNGTVEELSCQGNAPNYICGINKTGLTTGNYSYALTALDKANLTNITQTRWVIIDLESPQATMLLPGNNSYYNLTNAPDLNYTISDNFEVDTCSYTINEGSYQELINCQNTTLAPLINGQYNITLRVNDSAGNMYQTLHYFEINLSTLDIIPNYPINTTYHNATSLQLNISTNREVEECNYSIDGGTWTVMTNTTLLHWNASETGLSQGWHVINYTCADSVGVIENETINFTVDSIPPSVTILTPINSGNYSLENVSLNYTAIDATNLTCTYSLDGASYQPITNCQNITLLNLIEGNHNVTLDVTDQAGNTNTTFVPFTVDTILPNITVHSPLQGYYTSTTQVLNITTNEENITCTYEINTTGTQALPRYGTSQHNISVLLAEGNYTIEFKCEDFAGNTNQQITLIQIDTTKPYIEFVAPTETNGETITENFTTINVSTQEERNHSTYVDLDNSLLGYWNFENTSGTTVYDLSSYQRNATLRLNPSITNSENVRGNYVLLDGDTQDIEIPYSPDLDVRANYTVEAWIKEGNQSNPWATIVNKNGNGGFRLHHNADNSEFEFAIDGSAYAVGALPEGIVQGKWYHVVGTYDGETIRLYVNGQVVDTTSAITLTPLSAENLYIGSFEGSSARRFNGSIDEVKLWNRTLSQTEILASYQGKTYSLEQTYYNLSQGTHNYTACAIDVAGNHNCTEQRLLTIQSTALIDLQIKGITFNETNFTEHQEIQIQVNISNNGSFNAKNISLELNTSLWNGTKTYNTSLYSPLFNLSAGNWTQINFTWNNNIGTWIFEATADYENNITETNELNNHGQENLTVSAWHTYYGDYGYDVFLTNSLDEQLYNWTATDLDASVLFSDIDSSYYPFDLVPLNGTFDLTELDAALGLTGYSDSIKALYDVDNNGIADRTITATIAGNTLINIPIINSTNTSSFVTGILWDSNDGASYTGTQDVIFVTFLNASKTGYYGTYDFEVRLPSTLGQLTGVTDSLEQYMEVN